MSDSPNRQTFRFPLCLSKHHEKSVIRRSSRINMLYIKYICLKISTSNRGEDTAIEETKVVNCGRYKELWKSFLKTSICCI